MRLGADTVSVREKKDEHGTNDIRTLQYTTTGTSIELAVVVTANYAKGESVWPTCRPPDEERQCRRQRRLRHLLQLYYNHALRAEIADEDY